MDFTKLNIAQIIQAFAANGIDDIELIDTKYKSTGVGKLPIYNYNGLWYDDEEGQDAIVGIYVWVADGGTILADCDGHSKYIKDFL